MLIGDGEKTRSTIVQPIKGTLSIHVTGHALLMLTINIGIKSKQRNKTKEIEVLNQFLLHQFLLAPQELKSKICLFL